MRKSSFNLPEGTKWTNVDEVYMKNIDKPYTDTEKMRQKLPDSAA
ncbi:hypothetical protein GCM10008986_21210 [Salinibacillus aidingensis]|uniref:Uncharacterized protein n=1 Tax=Salinibacillus aidingensis TaxID=237684 RepID=A0ABN1BBV6_9BACI